MTLHESLEELFRTRGYSVIRSSEDNNFMILEKEGSKMTVGYSSPENPPTEGEADMYLSMAMNEDPGSMLFISPTEIPTKVKKELEKEKVKIWDRTTLAINLGELELLKHTVKETKKEKNPLDLFTDEEDIDPVKELRSYHEKEIGGFKVHEVKFKNNDPPPLKDVWDEVRSLGEEIVEEMDSLDEAKPPIDAKEDQIPIMDMPMMTTVKAEPKEEEPTPLMDMPMMSTAGSEPEKEEPAPIMDMPLMTTVKKDEEKKEVSPVMDLPMMAVPEVEGEKTDETPKKAGEDPWSGFEEWKDPSKKKEDPWIGSILLPMKYSKNKAISLANMEEDTELDLRYLPFLLIKATYKLESKETGEVMDKEGNYLYNSTTSRVTDVPSTLFDEIASVGERWTGQNPPDEMMDPKKGYNTAIPELKKRILESDLALDRKVRETLMATIFREIKYRFRSDSFKVESSRRLMVPFWIKKDDKSAVQWMVDGYLGRFVSKEE